MLYIIAQVIIGLNYLVFWASRFSKEKRNIIILDSIAKLLTITGFLSKRDE